MAFKMKLSSKELDGPYSFSNTDTEAIKNGSAALGNKGSIGQMKGSVSLKLDDDKTVNKITPKTIDVRTGGQLVPTRGDLTEKQNKEVVSKSLPQSLKSGKKKSLTSNEKLKVANKGELLGNAKSAENELSRRFGKK